MQVLIAVCMLLSSIAGHAAGHGRPNIIVILADDLGFSDIAPYGSEISTPNLDALAREGLRFSNFHVSASCAPTRAMLMTGVDSHRAGVSNIAEALTPEQRASPFYSGHLLPGVVTIASLLRDSGYHTYMAGKWHLGYKENSLRPFNRGFERTVMMPFSGADNWSNKSYLPMYEKALWFENGKEIELPEKFYSSEFLVDKTIEQIGSHQGDGKPFFTYLAFLAVHIPVQAPVEYTEEYIDTYRDGWTSLRERRQKAVQELGLISGDAQMKTMATTRDWQGLSDEEQRYNAKRMAVYAGMVDAMDHHIGRLLQYLKDIGEYENTVIFFTSDNGAEPSDPLEETASMRLFWLYAGYNRDYDTLGEQNSYNFIGPSFASAAVSPLGHYKFHAGEGGMRVPLIVSGPVLAEEHRGGITHARGFVKDLAATILDMASVQHPGNRYRGRYVEPMTGRSLAPVIAAEAETVYAPEDVIAYEIGGNAALIKGDYKIVYNRKTPAGDQWHLYNITRDPGETIPLEASEPEILSDMLIEYDRYVAENGVLPVPEDYTQLDQIMRNMLYGMLIEPLAGYVSLRGIVGVIILIFIILWVLGRQKRAEV